MKIIYEIVSAAEKKEDILLFISILILEDDWRILILSHVVLYTFCCDNEFLQNL